MSANGQTVAVSEGYSSLAACRKGVESVKKCAPGAKLADLTGEGKTPANPRFELYRDRAGHTASVCGPGTADHCRFRRLQHPCRL